MDIPNKLLYTKEHEWANFENEGVIVGITDYAQSQLGDIIFFETPELGSILNMGDIFGEIEAVKTVSELYAPISGKIISINNHIENNPEIINSDPYGEGWLIKMSPLNIKEKEKLIDHKSYMEFIK